jgi:hypothetical protein
MLLELPDPCLLAVLQYCAVDDQRSLFNAARAHSRLHQAAVLALRSITTSATQQQQVNSILLYLCLHGQHIDSINLQGDKDSTLTLCQLPDMTQLSSLQLHGLKVQLPRGDDQQGVLAAAAPLKQLQLSNCLLLGGERRLAAALAQLPNLEHLGIKDTSYYYDPPAASRTLAPTYTLASVLQQLQCLTYLELDDDLDMQAQDLPGQPRLQHLQTLTRLADLRLDFFDSIRASVITASILSGAHQLTRLQLPGFAVEPGALASKTQLQHLHLHNCRIIGGAVGVAQLLSHLQEMQQLTYLDLEKSLLYDWLRDERGEPIRLKQEQGYCRENRVTIPHPTAFAALTASSKLQHLIISGCTLPSGVWPHIFPAGRQLPHLQVLDIGHNKDCLFHPTRSCEWEPPLAGYQLVSCCPSLQSLDLSALPFHQELLGPLRGLSGLHTLRVSSRYSRRKALAAVCQLTGLRELEVYAPLATTPGLLQLAQLKQLTRLDYTGKDGRANMTQV